MPKSSKPSDNWMHLSQWEALYQGDKCPLCLKVCQSNADRDDYAFSIAELQISKLQLVRNQFVPGYCMLVCQKHVCEPYHLTREESLQFFDDLRSAAQAIDAVYNPLKMNFEILGNTVPHLHAHIVPRYYNDPAPGRPIDPTEQQIYLTEPEYEERVQQIYTVLTNLRQHQY